MGEPICRNLVRKSGAPRDCLRPFAGAAGAAGRRWRRGRRVRRRRRQQERHRVPVPAQRQACARGVRGRRHPEEYPQGPGRGRSRHFSVNQTRDFAGQLQAKGATWADAPIARTRQAAQDGTLSVMVGATPELFAAIEPLIRCFATDVTHCGDVGAGQVTKILNNMVLFETVNALAEAVALAQAQRRRSGAAARYLVEGLGRQLCAAQSRHEGDRAGQFSRTRVLDRICAEGSVLRAGTGRRRRHQDPRRRADRQDSAGSDRCRFGRGVFSGDREAY